MEKFTPAIESFKLIPSSGGRFEVMANERMIYSKKTEGRHAEEGELVRLFSQAFGVEPVVKQ